LDHVDPIDGIVVVDSDYLQGRKLFGQVTTTYRYGREEDEVMGLKFSKELVLAHEQLVPTEDKKTGLTPIQVMSAFYVSMICNISPLCSSNQKHLKHNCKSDDSQKKEKTETRCLSCSSGCSAFWRQKRK
jgi:hypothetical protein